MTHGRLQGVLSPVVTPFDGALRPDSRRLVRHCRWLLGHNVGLAVFGTNSEANSLSVAEKVQLLEDLVAAALPAGRMMPGTGCCALPDSVELTQHAVRLGCGGVLMLPPFYYKNVSDDGLFGSYAEIIERVGDSRLRVYLYHIPPIAQIPISLKLIERLLKAYPGTIAGIKDSSGDWRNSSTLLQSFQSEGFDVFVGSESFLLAARRSGGAGCISATANVNPGPIAALAQNWTAEDADRKQAELDAVRRIFQRYPMIAALKTAISVHSGLPEWAVVRPPLIALDGAQRDSLMTELDGIGFAMPGLAHG
ncbi:MAG: dihydrodipicolinate synthase family protein [Spirochaetaceae bacterium]|nr:MAG: dihydrodipicolinate synthase family protein [Spirochaetaceae bacterium]